MTNILVSFHLGLHDLVSLNVKTLVVRDLQKANLGILHLHIGLCTKGCYLLAQKTDASFSMLTLTSVLIGY